MSSSSTFTTAPKVVVQDPSTLHPNRLLLYVGKMLVDAHTNVHRHRDGDWSIDGPKSNVNAPSRYKGTKAEICHRLARWISLRHGVAMIDGLEARIPEIIWKLAGDKVAIEKERLRQLRIERLRKKEELRKLEKLKKLMWQEDCRPRIYTGHDDGIPWIEKLHGWLSIHVIDVGEGYLPVSLAVRAFESDIDFLGASRPREAVPVRAVMETIIHSMYNKTSEEVNGTDGWLGLDLDKEATDLLFGSCEK